MKKFTKEEVVYGIIKTHPKFEIYSNAGVVRFNRQNYPAEQTDVPIESISLEVIHSVDEPG